MPPLRQDLQGAWKQGAYLYPQGWQAARPCGQEASRRTKTKEKTLNADAQPGTGRGERGHPSSEFPRKIWSKDMQIYVPELRAAFVPIPKNASSTLKEMITRRWPDNFVVGPEYKARRVVMWRNPKDRIESTYRFIRDQGMEMPFAKWIVEICKEGLRDPHLKPQATFCEDPQELFRWDFDSFMDFFRIKKRYLIHKNESGTYPIEWDEKAKEAFKAAYARDIRIWGGYNAPPLWPEITGAIPQKDIEDERRGQISLGGSQIDCPGHKEHGYPGSR